MGNIIIPHSNITPSFKQGFARYAGESSTPNIWKEMRHATAYQLGQRGIKGGASELVKGYADAIHNQPGIGVTWGRGFGGEGTSIDYNGSVGWTPWINPPELDNFTYLSIGACVRLRTSFLGNISAKDNNSPPRCWQFRINSRKIEFIVWNQVGALATATGATVMDLDREYHVLGTWDGKNVKVYVNGVLDGSSTLAGTSVTTGAITTFNGCWLGTAQFFNGQIGNIIHWNRSLAQEEALLLASDPMLPFRLRRKRTIHAVAAVDNTGSASITLPMLFGMTNNVIGLPMLSVQGGSGATGAITLPILAVTSSGTPANSTGEITLPLLQVQGGSGATGAITLPLLVVASTVSQGSVTNDGTVTLPLLSVTGTANNPLSGAITLPSLTVLGEQKNRAIGSITLPMFTTETVAQQGNVQNISLTLPMLSLNAHSGLVTTIQLPILTVSANGSSGFLGTYDRILPSLVVNVKATQGVIVTGNLILPSLTIDGNLLTGIISLAGGNRTLPLLQINAHGFKGRNGDVVFTLPALTLSGVGYENPTGDVAITLPIIELDVFADVHINRII